MDHQQFFFSSQTPFMGSMTNDHLGPNYDFDPIIGSFGQQLDDFTLYDTSLFDSMLDSGVGLPLDAFSGSPSLEFTLDGDAPSCEAEDRGQICEAKFSETTKKTKRDRPKILLSERKRRSRMKEKLYELRSLVPNITKMDKASIIGDAVVYVKGLQDQAKALANEISVLESSSEEEEVGVPIETVEANKVEECKKSQHGTKIQSVEAHEVGRGRFYVRVECNKGNGIASSLYNAMESLDCFHMENSELSSSSGRFVQTMSLNVGGDGQVMTASAMKLWVMGALLKEGFGF